MNQVKEENKLMKFVERFQRYMVTNTSETETMRKAMVQLNRRNNDHQVDMDDRIMDIRIRAEAIHIINPYHGGLRKCMICRLWGQHSDEECTVGDPDKRIINGIIDQLPYGIKMDQFYDARNNDNSIMTSTPDDQNNHEIINIFGGSYGLEDLYNEDTPYDPELPILNNI